MSPDINPRVLIFVEAIEAMADESRASHDGTETGGILLGIDTGDTLQVRNAGGPGPGAIRRADYFLRDRVHAQRLVDKAWDTDGSDWIGDWHTHPQGPPAPSGRDRTTYRRILQTEHLAFERFLAIIVVPSDTCDGISCTPWLITSTASCQLIPSTITTELGPPIN